MALFLLVTKSSPPSGGLRKTITTAVDLHMSRTPRQLLTSWVAHSRPVGCPQMTWDRALENALKRNGISKEIDEWFAIAKGR